MRPRDRKRFGAGSGDKGGGAPHSVAELQQQVARLRAVFDSASDAIITINRRGIITSLNRGAEEMFGYAPGELVGRAVKELMPEPHRSEHDAHLAHYDGETRRVESPFWELLAQRKDGTTFPIDLSVSQATTDEYVGILRDITEERGVQRELVIAKELAEAGARAKAEFLAAMSHEIRTPMNGVIGMIGILLDTELSDEQRTYATSVRTSGEALLAIVNDILDFSKIEAGEMSLEPMPFDLRGTVEDTVDVIAHQAHSKGIEVAVDYPSSTASAVVGDPGRIRQILTNFLGNAIKFTSRGHIVLSIRQTEQNGRYIKLRISVTDTGLGIPEDRLPYIFNKFTQADGSTSRKFGGTGLGLAICKQLSALMGGTVGVDSVEGKGSTFWVDLELEAGSAANAPDMTPLVSGDTVALVCDRSSESRRVLSDMMSDFGVSSDVCPTVEDLRQRVAKMPDDEAPQLIVLDSRFAGTAVETVELVEDVQLPSGSKIVLLSWVGDASEKDVLADYGIGHQVAKPVRRARLREAIKEALLGGGTTVQARGDRPRVARVPAPASTEPRPPTRVLVVDDNRVNQMVACKLLEKLGCTTEVACNGLEAIEMVSTRSFEIVLMDCQMPEMDGYEATAQIRRLPQTSLASIPIIAMTANAMEGDRQKCLNAGMDDYVSKPVAIDILEETLDRWVANRVVPAANAS